MDWQQLNWADYTILSIIGFSTLVSLVRGFIREALSLFIWIGAFWIAYRLGPSFAQNFLMSVEAEGMRLPLGYGIVFISVLVGGAILNFAMSRLVYGTGLSGTDRVLGLVFGLARGILLVSILILVAPITAISKSTWWQQSELIPQFEGIAVYLSAILPEKMSQIPLLGNEKKALNELTVPPPPLAMPVSNTSNQK